MSLPVGNAGTTSPRLPELDIARGAAVLLVTIFHASLAFPETPLFQAINGAAGGVRMPLLLLVTGFLFARTSSIDKRLIQFGWVFAVWTLIVIIARALGDGGDIAIAYAREFVMPTSELWFIWAAGLLGLSLIVVRRLNPVLVVTVAGIVAISIESNIMPIDAYGHEYMVKLAFYFYLGAFFGAAILDFIRTETRRVFVWGVPLILAMRAVDYWAEQQLGWQVIGIAERMTGIVLALAIAHVLAAKVSAIADPLIWVGRNTMPIYVAHSLFIIPLATMLTGMLPVMAVVVLTASIIVASLALHRLVQWAQWDWVYAVPDWLMSRSSAAEWSPAAATRPVGSR